MRNDFRYPIGCNFPSASETGVVICRTGEDWVGEMWDAGYRVNVGGKGLKARVVSLVRKDVDADLEKNEILNNDLNVVQDLREKVIDYIFSERGEK